ncbi:c-type cytochrome domain-containing protein [Roseobacter sp. AzwK-3b]|uniref:c-type cytochrome domain-containing protein n=1 Tax=Roseobacter sp. AzwK-3b TaxID=351016 RepID=UPI0018DD19F0|nr:c-type cytochrome domain-containing protein [Roseobacter sp. AzwK-3b]
MTTKTNSVFVAIASYVAFATLPHAAAAETWQSVQAIFEERCVACHSGEYAPLGLALDSYQALMSGSENGSVVDIAIPQQSALVQRITGAAEPRMPLDGPPFLSSTEIATVVAWIAAGAVEPEAESPDTTKADDPYADGQITYDEVASVFGRHCVICHSDNGRYDSPPEGLRLSSLENILRGGERLAVLPSNAQASEIIRRVEGYSDPRMPLDGPPWLSKEETQLLRDWIDGGAKSEDGIPAEIPTGARVRMRGILTGRHEIDGAVFVVTGDTRIDDVPRKGGRAEVRGHISANGDIIADRFRDR